MKKELFASRLKELRQKQGLTLEELADKINATRSALSRYENGERTPKIDIVAKLADYFGVDMTWLAGFAAGDEAATNDIMQIYNQLTQPNQSDVYNYASDKLDAQQFGTLPLCEVVTMYGYASAGNGSILQDEQIDEIAYTGKIPKHDYALSVSGDSMLPLFSNGQIIFIKKTVEAYSNQIVIANVNGEGFVKKLVSDENGIRLISLNKKYDDIVINEHDDFSILGIVIL
jgi:SOS-response transcriptional repressors (RecA-mediated autopeptidases)